MLRLGTSLCQTDAQMARVLQAAILAMRTTLTSAVIATVLLGALEPATQDQGRAPATAKEVMTTMTVPASDAIFNAAANPPASPDDWAAVRSSAVTLAESGRLLMTDAHRQGPDDMDGDGPRARAGGGGGAESG